MVTGNRRKQASCHLSLFLSGFILSLVTRHLSRFFEVRAGLERDALDADFVGGAFVVVGARGRSGDYLRVVHAFDDLAEDSVLAVPVRHALERDEELAVGRVDVLRARRADDAALVRDAAELGGHVRQARTSHAVVRRIVVLRVRVAALYDLRVDSVEGRAVVEALRGESLEPLDHLRRDVRVKLDDDSAVVGFDDRGVRVRFGLLHSLDRRASRALQVVELLRLFLPPAASRRTKPDGETKTQRERSRAAPSENRARTS